MSRMVFICDGVPKACAGCGTEVKFNEVEQIAWVAGISYMCNTCGSLYQFSTKDNILDAADKTGDMKNLYQSFY